MAKYVFALKRDKSISLSQGDDHHDDDDGGDIEGSNSKDKPQKAVCERIPIQSTCAFTSIWLPILPVNIKFHNTGNYGKLIT